MPALKRFLFFSFIALAIFLFSPKKVSAAISITIDSSPSQARIGEEFTISVSMAGLEVGVSYYIKSRIGKTSSQMNKGETFNTSTSSWLGDTATWTDFPTISANAEGSASASLKSRAKQSAEVGENRLTVRLRKVGASSNAGDSDPVVINLIEAPTPTPLPTPTLEPLAPTPTSEPPTSTPTLSPTPTPKATKVVGTTLSGEILGEEASPEAFYPWQATQEGEEAQEATQSKRRILPYIFLGLGLTFLGVAAFWLWYTRLRVGKEGT